MGHLGNHRRECAVATTDPDRAASKRAFEAMMKIKRSTLRIEAGTAGTAARSATIDPHCYWGLTAISDQQSLRYFYASPGCHKRPPRCQSAFLVIQQRKPRLCRRVRIPPGTRPPSCRASLSNAAYGIADDEAWSENPKRGKIHHLDRWPLSAHDTAYFIRATRVRNRRR